MPRQPGCTKEGQKRAEALDWRPGVKELRGGPRVGPRPLFRRNLFQMSTADPACPGQPAPTTAPRCAPLTAVPKRLLWQEPACTRGSLSFYTCPPTSLFLFWDSFPLLSQVWEHETQKTDGEAENKNRMKSRPGRDGGPLGGFTQHPQHLTSDWPVPAT